MEKIKKCSCGAKSKPLFISVDKVSGYVYCYNCKKASSVCENDKLSFGVSWKQKAINDWNKRL
jgi:hypothetical protein